MEYRRVFQAWKRAWKRGTNHSGKVTVQIARDIAGALQAQRSRQQTAVYNFCTALHYRQQKAVLAVRVAKVLVARTLGRAFQALRPWWRLRGPRALPPPEEGDQGLAGRLTALVNTGAPWRPPLPYRDACSSPHVLLGLQLIIQIVPATNMEETDEVEFLLAEETAEPWVARTLRTYEGEERNPFLP